MEEISLIHDEAIQTFIAKLPEKDKYMFDAVTVSDVLADVESLERKQSAFSRTRRVSRRIDPLIKFLQRYAMAVDTMVQFSPQPSALAWGCMRFILELASSFSKYFSKIVDMMEQIGDFLPIYERYEQMFADSKPFREALAKIYFDVIVFLFRARSVFKSNALLTLTKVVWRPFESEFDDILKAIARHSKILENETTLAHRQTIHIERRRRVMEWLDPVDVESDLQREAKRMANGTCRWILEDRQFKSWMNPVKHDSLLWINGPPGSGKTVLSTFIIQDIRQLGITDHSKNAVYFFFDKNDDRKCTSASVISSIIAQLVGHLHTMPTSLLQAYQTATKFGRAHISASDEPLRILSSLISQAQTLYIVLDGLDECSDWSQLLEVMLDLKQKHSNVHILGVSRDFEPQKRDLSGYAAIKLDAKLTKKDIDVFLEKETTTLARLLGEQHLSKQFFEHLSRDAQGNFLWANLMINTLKTASSLHEIKAIMGRIPQGLSELYTSILAGLDKESEAAQSLAKRAFIWTCCSTRPLSWSELQCALAISPEDEELDASKMPFKNVIIRLCSPLIEYQAAEDAFRPIHLSVSEFLIHNRSLDSSVTSPRPCTAKKEAHAMVAAVSWAYLKFPRFVDSIVFNPEEHPLGAYATTNTCSHLVLSEATPILKNNLKAFVASAANRRIWLARWLLMDMNTFPLQRLVRALRSMQSWIQNAKYQEEVHFDPLHDMLNVLLELDSQDQMLEITSSGFQTEIGHFEKMMVVRDLARSYTVTGRLNDAQEWLTLALQDQAQRYGDDAIELVWILNSLGMVYDQQSKFQLSAETQLRALEIQKQQLPADHLDPVWTSNELGRVYRHLHQLDKAASMHMQALKILEPVLPENDTHIIWTLNCLGRTYRFQNKLDEALALHIRAFEEQKLSLGEDHPHTLWTMTDIARCLRDQGLYQDALQKQLAALEGRKKTLGPNHTDTCWTMNDVGLLLSRLGRRREAKAYHEEAFARQKSVLGENNEITAWTRDLLKNWEVGNKLCDSPADEIWADWAHVRKAIVPVFQINPVMV